jgi:hypothetical protein
MFTTPPLPQQSQELQVPHENEARAQRRCDSCDTRFRSEGPIRVAHTIAADCDTGDGQLDAYYARARMHLNIYYSVPITARRFI